MKQQKQKLPAEPTPPLYPDLLYRINDARKYFGYRPTQLAERIKSGDVPAPVRLSSSGRAAGWFGRQIIAWQAERIAASAKAEA